MAAARTCDSQRSPSQVSALDTCSDDTPTYPGLRACNSYVRKDCGMPQPHRGERVLLGTRVPPDMGEVVNEVAKRRGFPRTSTTRLRTRGMRTPGIRRRCH